MSFAKGDHRYDFEVSCPFNINHKMPKSRLLYHLTKGCMDKQKKGHLYTQCPYNFLHFLRNDLVEYHIKNCKTRIRQEKHSNKLSMDEQQELEDLVLKQFVTKELDQDSNQPMPIQTQTKNDINESLPSWSCIVNDLYGTSTDSRQSDFQNNWLSDTEEEEEYQMIATMNNNNNNNSRNSDNSFYSVRSEQFQKKERQLDISNANEQQNVNLTQQFYDKSLNNSYRVRGDRNQNKYQKHKSYIEDDREFNPGSLEKIKNDFLEKNEEKQEDNNKFPKRYDRDQYQYYKKQSQQGEEDTAPLRGYKDTASLRGYKDNLNQQNVQRQFIEKNNHEDSQSRHRNQKQYREKRNYYN